MGEAVFRYECLDGDARVSGKFQVLRNIFPSTWKYFFKYLEILWHTAANRFVLDRESCSTRTSMWQHPAEKVAASGWEFGVEPFLHRLAAEKTHVQFNSSFQNNRR